MSDELQSKEAFISKMKERIIDIVNERGPISAVTLAVEVVSEMYSGKWGKFDVLVAEPSPFPELLEAAIVSGDIVECEWINRRTEYKVSSLLFPKDSVLQSWRGGSVRDDFKSSGVITRMICK